jgi:uncharacterized protein
LLDSAEAYGDSLNVIGSYLKKQKHQSFALISKFIGGDESLKKRVARTCAITGQDSLYALMYHRFSDYSSGVYKDELLLLVREGKIQKIGISLYGEAELEAVLSDPDISVVQIPFHPFDARTRKKDLMAQARSEGKEIHVRSIFLQGLFFKSENSLTGNMLAFKEPLERFHNVIKLHGGSVRQACLNYALHQPYIDRVIVGVETAEQLYENTSAILHSCPDWILNDLETEFVEINLLNPSNWKP